MQVEIHVGEGVKSTGMPFRERILCIRVSRIIPNYKRPTSLFSFFKKKAPQPDLSLAPKDFSFLGTDMHSHLVPGIDDGAEDAEMSLAMIRRMKELGWSKLITTPHVQREFYDNDSEKIRLHFERHQRFIADQRLGGIELAGVAAEYYLDNFFMMSVLPEEQLLPFAKNYVLVEVSMAGWPRTFSDMVFSIQSRGLVPVLAHPERYQFEENLKVYEEWKSKGMLFQMNLLSPAGYYGRGVKELALRYMDAGLYDFCGSDAHGMRHLEHAARMAEEQPAMMLKLSEYPHWRNSSL